MESMPETNSLSCAVFSATATAALTIISESLEKPSDDGLCGSKHATTAMLSLFISTLPALLFRSTVM